MSPIIHNTTGLLLLILGKNAPKLSMCMVSFFIKRLQKCTMYNECTTYVSFSVALATKKFDVAEKIKSFDSLQLTWTGFVVNLKTELYILVNVEE